MKPATIELIKKVFESEGDDMLDDDELKTLEEKKKSASYDDLVLGKLIIEICNIFESKLNVLEDSEENIDMEEVKEVLKGIDRENLLKLLREYKSGREISDNYIKLKIEKEVEEHRESYEDFIKLFFSFLSEIDN
tara:strand:+ start:2722 stop:3126 length:405 start_codon:yes stop_codon:yes gene_type:complete